MNYFIQLLQFFLFFFVFFFGFQVYFGVEVANLVLQ